MNARRLATAIAGSAAAVAAATGLVYALRPIAPTLSLGVLYTPAVLAVSVFWGLGFAVATALASMLAFNFLFLPPVHTFTLTDGRNWAALGVYVVTGVVASELATSARRRAREAEQREREAALLSDAAAALLQEMPLDDIQARADRLLRDGGEHARARFQAAITSLLALAEERRAAESVRRSDEIKTVILQTVSHDFRTPLATMRAAVGSLEDPQLALSERDRAELLETIGIETDRLSRLVENVLDLSRLQAGAAAPHPELWSVHDLLVEAARETTDPARIAVDAPHDLPAARVDAVQIQRVLVNLLENALAYSAGSVELGAVVAGRRLVIEVLDRGPGLQAVTEPKGLGLGLSIARGFTEANGGTLVLEPRAGGGTRARVVLPSEPVPAGIPS